MPLTTIKSSNIKDSEIKNADISPTASITESKIAGLDAAQISANAFNICLLYTSPSPRDRIASRMPSSA